MSRVLCSTVFSDRLFQGIVDLFIKALAKRWTVTEDSACAFWSLKVSALLVFSFVQARALDLPRRLSLLPL